MVGEFAVALDRKGDNSHLNAGGNRLLAASSSFIKKGNAKYEDKTVFRVEGETQQVIDAAISDLKDYGSEVHIDKVIDGDFFRTMIAQLSIDQVERIQGLEDNYLIKIVIEKGLRNRIVISGESEVVTFVQEKVFEIFDSMKSAELEKIESKTLNSQARWMFDDRIRRKGDCSYPDEINVIIEKSYQKNLPAVYWTEEDGTYSVNFNDMFEYKIGSTTGRKVTRAVKEMQLPSCWEPMFPNESLRKVPLKGNTSEYKNIARKVQLPRSQKIIKIERIQNPSLYKQYLVRKEHMERNWQPGKPDIERQLWHGTSTDTVANINQTGFNRSYCGKNATAYGQGVYFARDFIYSAKDNYSVPSSDGHKSVYHSLVLSGELTLGQSRYVEPPLRTGSTSGGPDRYDSVVNDPADPEIFVIFSDTQAYPQYLITFK